MSTHQIPQQVSTPAEFPTGTPHPGTRHEVFRQWNGSWLKAARTTGVEPAMAMAREAAVNSLLGRPSRLCVLPDSRAAVLLRHRGEPLRSWSAASMFAMTEHLQAIHDDAMVLDVLPLLPNGNTLAARALGRATTSKAVDPALLQACRHRLELAIHPLIGSTLVHTAPRLCEWARPSSGEGLVLLDWEDAAVGDPRIDAGALFAAALEEESWEAIEVLMSHPLVRVDEAFVSAWMIASVESLVRLAEGSRPQCRAAALEHRADLLDAADAYLGIERTP